MKVLILAAGYGTRLYPVIKDTPKPLLPIAGQPLINHTLKKLRTISGLKELLVVTNDKFHGHFQAWARSQKSFPAPVTILNDGTTSPENRLGSIGDIQFVLQRQSVQDDLLIVGGDNLFDFNLRDYLAFAKVKCPRVSIGLYDIRNIKEATQFGVVELGRGQKIISFEEKPPQPRSTLIAMCCYYLPEKSIPLIDQYIRQTRKTDKAGDYIQWLTKDHAVYGFTFQGKWFDIGSLEAYREADREFKSRKRSS